jgi:hypothetical protein
MRARFFFPGGLDPVLNRGPGDEDAMIAPEVPTRRAIRQAVLDDQADGRLLHAMGVVTLGQRQVGHVGGEAPSAVAAEMFGVGDHEIDRPAGADVAQIVKGPSGRIAARGRPTAPRALAAAVVPTPPLEMRGRKILDPRDPFSNIGDVVAWPIHNPLLLTNPSS